MDTARFERYLKLIDDLIDNETVCEMKEFIHHKNVNCFEHSLHVSYYSYLVCRFLQLDYVSAARGGLLHDLFLYDWRVERLSAGAHAFQHPLIALENANKTFTLNRVEQDIIKKHMWPVTPALPRYFESFVVGCVDKFCACKEVLFHF
jgi:uncharacterized protein